MKDVSDRKSYGAEWEPVDGLKFQLFNRKGTDRLEFQSYRNGRSALCERVQEPSRFGMHRAPESYDEFYAVACRYSAEVERNTEYARKHTRVIREDGSTRAVR